MNKFCSFMLVMLIAASTSLFAADAPKQDYYQNHISMGKFSVSPTKMVYLCTANLEYNPAVDKMFFNTQPFERRGENNKWASETYPQYAYKANDFYIHSDSPSRENWDCSESTPQRTTLSDVRRKDVRCTG